jgi:hypothetical protein
MKARTFPLCGGGIGIGLPDAPSFECNPDSDSERFWLSFLLEAAISRQGMFNLRLETANVQPHFRNRNSGLAFS